MAKGRRNYPKLPDLPGVSEEALDSFDAYLTGVISQAMRAYQRSNSRVIDDPHDWLKNQRRYWQNGVSILRWLRGQIRHSRAVRGQPRGETRGDSP